MNKIIKSLFAIFIASLLAACGTGGSATPGSSQSTDLSSVDYFLANLSSMLSLGANAPAPVYNVSQTVTTKTLETFYENLFCKESSVTTPPDLSSKQCQDNINFIANATDFNLSNKPIQNNPLGIQDVNVTSLIYNTTVPLPKGAQTFQVSGGLIMPNGITASQIKGVVVYFHGTTFTKYGVGSQFTAEAEAISAVLASQGYIVVIPDYVGQGIDYNDVHPYVLYPQASAQTAIDMLSAVKPMIQAKYGGKTPLKLFSTGYSEGGAYSLWFNTYIQTVKTNLDSFYALTHSVGLEGAYSTSGAVGPFLFSDVSKNNNNPFNIETLMITNAVKGPLSADAFLSFATYEPGQSTALFNQKFYSMTAFDQKNQTNCNINGTQMNMTQAFALESTNIIAQIVAASGKKSSTQNSKTYTFVDTNKSLDLATATNNNVYALLANDYDMSAINARLLLADVNLSSISDNNISIVSLVLDSVVTPNNYTILSKAYSSPRLNAVGQIQNSNIKVYDGKVKGVAIYSDVDHLSGLIYEYLYALKIFNQY